MDFGLNPVSEEGDLLALFRIHHATNGSAWRRGWNTSSDITRWNGITRDAEGRVVWLSLRRNNLRGIVPAEVASLTALYHLDLAQNVLIGPIPTTLGNLRTLTVLYLSRNKLSGSIPKELGGLEALLQLRLDDNSLSGWIPTELGNLTALKSLWLQNNKLSGPIPKELGNLVNLSTLHLFNNKLSGCIPEELGNLERLLLLYLYHNQLSGGVPSSLRARMNSMHYELGIPEDGAPVPPWKSCSSLAPPLLLGYLDLITDISTVVSYYSVHVWWFALGLTFVVGPALIAAIVFLPHVSHYRRFFVAIHLGLLVESLVSLHHQVYSHVLVTLRVVEPLYESVPQLMLQTYALFMEWGNDSLSLPFQLLSLLVSCLSLAYATTGMVAEQPLSQLSSQDNTSCPTPTAPYELTSWSRSVTPMTFGRTPKDGSVRVLRSQLPTYDFVWVFFLYQVLEIASRFISLALLAIALREYFLLVVVWLWASRAVILRYSLGRRPGDDFLYFRGQLRLVGMPFMDSVMDSSASYMLGVLLTSVEFVLCIFYSDRLPTDDSIKLPSNVRHAWVSVAAVCMLGKVFLSVAVVLPFKADVGFGHGNVDHPSRMSARNRAVVETRNDDATSMAHTAETGTWVNGLPLNQHAVQGGEVATDFARNSAGRS